jgi:DNA mismatch repair protein MutS
VPLEFAHRQTVANAMRYTTGELLELEQKLNAASTEALKLELSVLDDLQQRIRAQAADIMAAASAMAALDVWAGLAELAEQYDYVCPEIRDDTALEIIGGRHPVVERMLAQQSGGAFIPNDCALPYDARLWLLTGPNMAGKSTFLRQNALIVLLAQMGSFVPASRCVLGVVDRVFSRVGAADDLARGSSTFMVEMTETAAILHQATARSFVILDEIGRGTATYDGWRLPGQCSSICMIPSNAAACLPPITMS